MGSSLYNMAVQTSNIISTQIYQNKDKPLYYTGNKVLLGLAAYNVVLFIGAKVYYTLKNKYVFVLCCKKTDVLKKNQSTRQDLGCYDEGGEVELPCYDEG